MYNPSDPTLRFNDVRVYRERTAIAIQEFYLLAHWAFYPCLPCDVH